MNREQRRAINPKKAWAAMKTAAIEVALEYKKRLRGNMEMADCEISAERAMSERDAPQRTAPISKGAVLLPVGKDKPLHCFQNVRRRLKEDPSLTWQVGITSWKIPGSSDLFTWVYEGHVVIKHPDGRLEDVTAVLGSDTHIHFTPIN